MKKIELNWEEYQNAMTALNDKIDFDEVDLIVGITRGGLVPAIHLSNQNDIEMLPLSLSFRDNHNPEAYKKDLEEIKKYNNILIIDDIYDSGKTIAKIKEDLVDKNLKFYTIYSTDKNAVDYYSIIKETEDWILFPWEHI